MAITFSFKFRTPLRAVYLATRAAGGLTAAAIPNSGGASPDLLTDIPDDKSPLAQLVRTAVANNTAAQALLQESGTARISVMPKSGAGTNWAIRGVEGGGRPSVTVEYDATNGVDGNDAYVEIQFVPALQRSRGPVG